MGSSESWAWKRHRNDVWRLRGKHGLNPGVLESGTVQRCQESQMCLCSLRSAGFNAWSLFSSLFFFFPLIEQEQQLGGKEKVELREDWEFHAHVL